MDYSQVKGFNYQPSYGSSGFELWRKFDADVINLELARGKGYFPGMNAIRLWLSWDAFIREPKRFAENFDTALGVAAKHDLLVMPVLFNRWHDNTLDYGGIYLDHFLPRVSWVQREAMFQPYLEAIVGVYADDRRILTWDLCNEPFSYSRPQCEIPEIVSAEYAWLESLYRSCKELGATAPITVGIHPGDGAAGLRQVLPISDILSIHPYWIPPRSKAEYEQLLDDYVAISRETGKPLIATETCWGSLDDAERVEIIRYTLTQLKERGIGWLVYLLHHSLIADAHRPKFGPVGFPGNLSFIEADGSLRVGHGIFNEF